MGPSGLCLRSLLPKKKKCSRHPALLPGCRERLQLSFRLGRTLGLGAAGPSAAAMMIVVGPGTTLSLGRGVLFGFGRLALRLGLLGAVLAGFVGSGMVVSGLVGLVPVALGLLLLLLGFFGGFLLGGGVLALTGGLFPSAAVFEYTAQLVFLIVAAVCQKTEKSHIYKNCVKRHIAQRAQAYHCEKCKNNCEKII